MQIPQKEPSMIGKSLDWIANYTYRKIPSMINSFQKKPIPPKKLSFQDYVKQPQLAREAGLLNVRQKRKQYGGHKQGIERVISQFKSNAELMKQNPHEILCAICFELFSGPVTTSCNHTFCRMCIDESILFNPNCPSCRKNIRGQQLIVSKATEAIIRMILYKLQIDEVERFVKKQLEYQEWLQKRTLKRKQLQRDQLIDVRDTENIWCKGSIIEMLPLNVSDPSKYEYVLVHYEGWASRFDEVIPLESMRLATSRFYMSRYEIPHYNLDPNNPEHYRCPVVIGPPQPVAPIVEEPIMSESDSSDDDQIVFIDQEEEIIHNQSNVEGNQDSSLSQQSLISRSNSNSGQMHVMDDLHENSVISYQDFQQNQPLFTDQQILVDSERNDNLPINHIYQNNIFQQQILNNSHQGISLQSDFSVENFHYQYHTHSLPEERILGDLIESDFGQMIYDNGDGNYRHINSQVDERIFREVNQQMQQRQSISQDQILFTQLLSQVALQNPEQKSHENVSISNKMNEHELQIKQNQQLLENENEDQNDKMSI